MSHVALIKLEVKDLDCLSAACKRLGLELVRGQKKYKSYQSGLTCDHAIRKPGNESAYEVGVQKQADGRYTLAFDSYGQHYGIPQYAGGNDLPKLKQWYAAEVAAKHAKRQGWQGVRIMQTNDGRPKVIATR